jgi:hypothetical protein
MKTKVRCLSLYQPWATLLAAGAKTVETRSWPAPRTLEFSERVMIHASQKWSPEQLKLCNQEPFRDALIRVLHLEQIAPSDSWRDFLPFGAIVGYASFLSCYPTERVDLIQSRPVLRHAFSVRGDSAVDRLLIGPDDHAFGDYSPNRFAWHFRDHYLYTTPISYKGRMGLFSIEL